MKIRPSGRESLGPAGGPKDEPQIARNRTQGFSPAGEGSGSSCRKTDPESGGRTFDSGGRSLGEAPAAESEEVAPGIIVDYDEKGRAVGIEMLHLSKRAPGADSLRLLFESVPS
ncbi:MAG: DUF2283 domain-containing protein, partial [Nitrospirae bacterium]|nr:DUF2283 domain-containing protein [Nitrospirota bacterium]